MAKFNIFSAFASVRKSFEDTFNRTNQSGLGTASDGTVWTVLTGAWEILSNKARGGSAAYPLAVVNTPTANNSIELTGVTQGATAALWVTNSGEWWGVGIDRVAEQCNCQTCSSCNAYNASNCSGTAGGNCVQDQCNAWNSTCTGNWNSSNCNAFTSTCNSGRNGQFTFANYNCNAFNSNSCNSWNSKNCKTWNSVNCSTWARVCTRFNSTKNCAAFTNACFANNTSNCSSFNSNSCNSWNSKNCSSTGNVIFNSWNACAAWSSSCSGFFNTSFCNSTFSICASSNCIAWSSINCVTYNASNCSSESFFSCNCQTCYPQYIRVIRSVGSVVSTLTSWAVSSVVQSFRVITSGNQITVQAYSDTNLVNKIDNDLVYTPSGVQANPTFGIMIKPSDYDQGYDIDSVKITRPTSS